MLTSLPAVQRNCKKLRKICHHCAESLRYDKRRANRRYRRALNRITHQLHTDPERWDGETFTVPSLSNWDLY